LLPSSDLIEPSPPVNDGDIATELRAIRHGAAIHYVSDWHWLTLRGRDHLDFLQRMCTNTVDSRDLGEHVEVVFADARGRIIERADLCRVTEESTLLVLGPGEPHTLPEWLDRYIFSEDIEFCLPATGETMIELLGPEAHRFLEGIPCHDDTTSDDLDLMIARLTWAGVDTVRLVGAETEISRVWKRLVHDGAIPVGEAAWNVHRIESGVPLRGAELSDAHNPWEARLSGAVDLNKGCYIGQEVIARLEAYDKVKQSLVGLLLPDGASENDRLLHDGKDVGYVCSAAQHPEQRRIGLGYVRNVHAHPKTELEIDGRQDMCQIVDLPMH
jgi:hypothetical protein